MQVLCHNIKQSVRLRLSGTVCCVLHCEEGKLPPLMSQRHMVMLQLLTYISSICELGPTAVHVCVRAYGTVTPV